MNVTLEHYDSKKDLEIAVGIHLTPFGFCCVGISQQRICHISFVEKNNKSEVLKMIKLQWPQAKITFDDVATKKIADSLFISPEKSKKNLRLLVKGTDFQLQVWKALLTIPQGKTVSYLDIAKMIGSPKAVRAVGTACGKNSLGFLIPCHRVLTSSGKLGGYRWGIKRKEALLAWESR